MGIRGKWAAYQARLEKKNENEPWYEKPVVFGILFSRPLAKLFAVSLISLSITAASWRLSTDLEKTAEWPLATFLTDWMHILVQTVLGIFLVSMFVQKSLEHSLRAADDQIRWARRATADATEKDLQLEQLRARVEKLEAALVAKDGKAGPSQG